MWARLDFRVTQAASPFSIAVSAFGRRSDSSVPGLLPNLSVQVASLSCTVQVPLCEVVHQEKRTEQNPSPTPSPPPASGGLGEWPPPMLRSPRQTVGPRAPPRGGSPCVHHYLGTSLPWKPPVALLPWPHLLSAHSSNRHLSLPSSKSSAESSWELVPSLPASNHSHHMDHQQSLAVPKLTRAHPWAFALPLSLPRLLRAWPLLFFDLWLKGWFCGRAERSG